MLFNSLTFIVAFFPIVVVGERLLRPRGRLRLWFLVAASLVFYGWWSPMYLLLVAASVGTNFAIGRRLMQTPSKRLLIAGIGWNLGLLGWFKYAGFFAGSINALVGADLPLLSIVLPLAISFFTFQQIAFLVDAHRGKAADRDPLRYALFVVFFPQLIAGPIVHHSEIMPQFDDEHDVRSSKSSTARGVTLFIAGLAKKVLIADTVAGYSDAVFGAAELGMSITSADAWLGTLAYTVQIYFDFSGYTDMALGAALILGIRLPFNFDSPYKARSIIEFWRRWHMTLSRFLRDYLYIPLGGNRRGAARRYVNLIVTMILGGLWHGAGWNFVIWGALHGTYLLINHAWRARKPSNSTFSGLASWVTTFLAVAMAWVFFRAPNLDVALRILGTMAEPLGSLTVLPAPSAIINDSTALAGQFSRRVFAIVAVGGAIAVSFFGPNSQEIIGLAGRRRTRMAWRPVPRWGVAVGFLGTLSLVALQSDSPFLYFQF